MGRGTADPMPLDKRLVSERFPRSSQYHPEWVMASASGRANALWVTEWLTTAMDLRPGMRVLDLGCGRAMSSIFLHREFFLLPRLPVLEHAVQDYTLVWITHEEE